MSAGPHRIGTLQYGTAGLVRLFSCFVIGGLTYSMVYQIDPRVLPIVLREHGATNQQIAIIIGSLTLLINSFTEPIVGYRSDRTRGRWGRRIPFIFWLTPVVSLFILAVPYSPEFTQWAMRIGWLARAAAILPWTPVILTFTALILLYKVFYNLVAAVYLGLIPDVVPASHLGRFHTIFRVLGALSTFAGYYWLVGLASSNPKSVFASFAVLNLVGFWAICWLVKEGTYPAPEEPAPAQAGPWKRFLGASGDFLSEAFRHPVYRWTYMTRVLIFAANSAAAFVIFFGRDDLGMSFDRTGKLLALSSLGWIALAYPMCRLLDRWGSIRTLHHALWLGTFAYVASFFVIAGGESFFAASLATSTIFWIIWSAEIMLSQQIFNRNRMVRLGAANSIVKSVIIAFVTSPLVGWLLDIFRGFSRTVRVPGIGPVVFGQYRFIFLVLAAMYALALLSLYQVRAQWRRLGGPEAYRPPAG